MSPETRRVASDGDEPSLDFESQFEALMSCVTNLESGRLSLDDSLVAYRDGIELVRKCRTILEQAQARVELIEDIDDEGVAKTSHLNLDVDAHEALRAQSKPRRALADDDPF
jgi:exodeoxyribonuclease VII small subunit